MKFLHLNFLPRSTDLALLILRAGFGGLLLWLHGWGKLMNFSAYAEKFANPFGIGGAATLSLVIFAEVACAALIVAGAFTRTAALIAAFNMAMAFKIGHGARLTGAGNGELALLFFLAFAALFFAGAGKFSIDANIGAKS